MLPAVKATMRTSVRGSEGGPRVKRRHTPARRLRRGFTLIELIVVVAIIALAAAVASLALRDPAASQLEREAVRLSALLESARAQARAMGLTVVWRPIAAHSGNPVSGEPPTGFRFAGLPRTLPMPDQWLNPAVRAEVQGAPLVLLGPEPLIAAQRIVLRLDEQSLALATDGLGPFVVQDLDATAPSAAVR